ncbi:MAG: uracil-DNA glycosylase [Dehalococcoidia bacterium]|nr:uracil-DNA glycosylase [Dehalococcoidia bacterium]
MSEIEALCQSMLGCRECGLSDGRTRVVPGEGPDNPRIVFIGEAPGWQEDQQGRPFVGPSGQLLSQMLAAVGIKRQEVYICNIVKCRPPNNRDPLPTEISACKHWLDAQLELLKPKVIVTLGRYSLARYFSGESIGKIHGRHVKRDGVIYFPMYHPAAALHQGGLRSAIEEDMKKLAALLHDASAAQEEKMQDKAEEASSQQQLSLF